MDKRISELIEWTRDKWGLNRYTLKRQQLSRKINLVGETVYTLSMEWFPDGVELPEEEDLNPEGTAVIELDVNQRRFESVIFVGSKTYADGVSFKNKETMIAWIENETDLRYGEHFQLRKEEKREYHFTESVNGIPLSPSGAIEIKFDETGKLAFFSVNGPCLANNKVKEESFALDLQKVVHIAKDQLKLIEFPSYEKKQLVPAYAIEEIYITNDGLTTIPFELFEEGQFYFKINQTLHWNSPITTKVERTPIDFIEKVTPDQAFSCEPHPDAFPITETQQQKSMEAVKRLLRYAYPEDSGKWELKALHREKGYIVATLKQVKPSTHVFHPKLMVYIDRDKLEVVNYMDNQFLTEMVQEFEVKDKVRITRDEAYQKIQNKLELTPVYVYDANQRHYILCGKLDCQLAIHAASGNVIPLDEL